MILDHRTISSKRVGGMDIWPQLRVREDERSFHLCLFILLFRCSVFYLVTCLLFTIVYQFSLSRAPSFQGVRHRMHANQIEYSKLVGGFSPCKNISQPTNPIPNIEENKRCLKPPASKCLQQGGPMSNVVAPHRMPKPDAFRHFSQLTAV